MTRAQTTTREVTGHDAETGEAVTIKINVPVGSSDSPSDEAERIMRVSQNPENWKLAVSDYHTFDKSIADDLAYCYNFYFGGHELS